MWEKALVAIVPVFVNEPIDHPGVSIIRERNLVIMVTGTKD